MMCAVCALLKEAPVPVQHALLEAFGHMGKAAVRTSMCGRKAAEVQCTAIHDLLSEADVAPAIVSLVLTSQESGPQAIQVMNDGPSSLGCWRIWSS